MELKEMFQQMWQYMIYIGVKQLNRFCVWLFRFVERFAKGRIEPSDSVWVNEITLSEGKIEERYWFPTTVQEITVSHKKYWSLFVVKNVDLYLFRTSASALNFSPAKSTISFLYVEYTHAEMESPIELLIPSSYLYDKNEILSAAFVLWLLQKQSHPFIFDELYTLFILDHNAEQVSLQSYEYIALSENNYKIHVDQVLKDKYKQMIMAMEI